MFETFKEKYNELEKKYDEKKYDDVVREGGKIIESLVAYIFINFPSTLKTIQQKQLFFNFEKKFQSEGKNKFIDFISRPTIGISIGFYKQLCSSFKAENHIWLKESIVPALSSANSIRNKFAHTGNSKPSDDDASDLLDSFEEIIEELNLQDAMPDSLGIPLASYLIYKSIMHSFDSIAQKEEDWKKIISDSKKIIPQLFKYLFYSKYYAISIEDKELLFSDDTVFANDDKENNLSIYENIFKKLKLSKLMDSSNSNTDSLIEKYLTERKEKYDRRGVKPYTKLLELLVNSLIKSNYEEYLKYSIMIKNKYLHGNEIDNKERIELKSYAKSLSISSKSAYRIEQEVIQVINNELTLYQTLKSTEKEDEGDTTTSPIESMLINMIKAGASEEVVINVAEAQNFKGDLYHLLSKYINKKRPVKDEKLKKDSIPKSEEKEENTSSAETNISSDQDETDILKAFGLSPEEDNSDSKAGSDLKINIPLTLEEISKETIKKLSVTRYVKCSSCEGSGAKTGSSFSSCSTCAGTGKVKKTVKSLFGDIKTEEVCEDCNGFGEIFSDKCPACLGEGRVKEESSITLTIPAGVSAGQTLKLKGCGEAGKRNEQNGDLLCILEEVKHKSFRREGDDIFHDLILSEKEATSGGDKIVPTLYGNVKMKINAAIQPGKILRLKGKGLPKLSTTEYGDMFVNIIIQPD